MSKELFQSLETPPADAIFALTARYREAVSFHKAGTLEKAPINLGVGKYVNSEGLTPLMGSFTGALKTVLEERLSDKTTGGYQPIPGAVEYRKALEDLVLGEDLAKKRRADGVLVSAQALGGTGANFLQGHLLNKLGVKEIVLSNPTWGNHKKIFPLTGLRISAYPYYSFSDSQVVFDEMKAALSKLSSGTAVSFHACCHNPTGADLLPSEWDEVLNVVKEKELISVFDCAYAGFGGTVEEDLYGVRKSIELEIPTLIAFSFSKIASLYEERVGGILVALPKGYSSIEAIEGNLSAFQRTSVSNPPALFARALTRVLTESSLIAEWRKELQSISDEIKNGGQLLAKQLDKLGVPHGGITDRNGMFAILPFSPEQVAKIEKEEQVYMLSNGRINVAAVKDHNAAEIAERMARAVS